MARSPSSYQEEGLGVEFFQEEAMGIFSKRSDLGGVPHQKIPSRGFFGLRINILAYSPGLKAF